MSAARKPYPSDVSDAGREFLAPYLTLGREGAPQREYPLRDVFDALRYVVRAGCRWGMLPHDLPPSAAVYQQARRSFAWPAITLAGWHWPAFLTVLLPRLGLHRA
jgi:transposase